MRKNTNMIKVVQFIHGLNMGGAEKSSEGLCYLTE